MEKSPWPEFPAEIRLIVYAEVSKSAKIRIFLENIPWDPMKNDEPGWQLKYNSHCGINFTCREIKAESAVLMWSITTWVAERAGPMPVWLHHIHRILATERAIKYIVNLRGVALPISRDVVRWFLPPAHCSLHAFPRLQTCVFTIYDGRCNVRYNIFTPAFLIGDRLRTLPKLLDGDDYSDYIGKVLPFHKMGTIRILGRTPLDFLSLVGIKKSYDVQMIILWHSEKHLPPYWPFAWEGNKIFKLYVLPILHGMSFYARSH